MPIAINAALSAYRAAAQSSSGVETSTDASNGLSSDPGGSFAGILKQGLSQALDMGKTAESMEVKGLAGQADMRDVVMAVSNAEQALSTVVAVRDKVVNAYQEILKMPI